MSWGRWIRFRLLIVGAGILLGLGVVGGRAAQLMVFMRPELASLAQREFIRRIKLPPRRGIIFDRNHQELALSVECASVYARPVVITTPGRTGWKLARILGLEPRKIVRKLKSEKGFVWIARRIPPQKAKEVLGAGLKGVGVVYEPKRFYPYTTLACHVLGFAGLDAKGLEGLELMYDKLLRAPGPTLEIIRDALGRRIQLAAGAPVALPEGHHLILTLHKQLQYEVEKILAQTVARYHAAAGQAVVLEPTTGEVLAMAVVPAFNPNIFGRYPPSTYRNRTITDAFEPGSTFKLFVAAAALTTAVASPSTVIDCKGGKLKIAGRTIHDTHPHNRLTLTQVIKFSSNIGAAKLAQMVGARRFYQVLKRFGFGERTGIDLPGEVAGILRRPERWGPVELATIAFGQGVAVTTLQLVRAVAAIANGGVLMRPYVVKAVVDSTGHLVEETTPRVVRRVLTPAQARVLTRMMVEVTRPGGTGERARVEGLEVAGKTGTAQKPLPTGGYSHSQYISSFVGFVPAWEPVVAIAVVIDTPRGAHYGGVVAAPAFARIARAALKLLGRVPGAGVPPAMEVRAPLMVGSRATLSSAMQELAQGVVPRLGGLTLREVLKVAGKAGVRVEVRGWGRVVRQSPQPGRPLAEAGGKLKVILSPPGGRS